MSLLGSVFGIDYWRATIWTDRAGITPLLDVLGLSDGLEDTGHGGIGYRSLEFGLHNFQLYSDVASGTEQRCTISLPAAACDYVGAEKLQAAAEWLAESGLRWRSTRCDLAHDTQDFSMNDIAAAAAAGDLVFGGRKINENKDHGGGVGHTIYFGSRESTAYLACYHKTNGASFGDEAFTRVELRLHGERADMAFLQLMAADMAEWARLAGELLRGFISITRDWWQKWVAGIGSSWLRLKRAVPSIQKAQAWLEKQVAPSLAMVAMALAGEDRSRLQEVSYNLIYEGIRRLSPRQWRMVREYDADTVQKLGYGAV